MYTEDKLVGYKKFQSVMNWKNTIPKVVVYIILLIFFVKFYMIDVLQQYREKKTNFAKYHEPIKGVYMPALSFCFEPMIKRSIRQE